MVLKNLNLTIEAGQTVAFTGPSGCGKSTIISLIQKFYRPDSGTILVDGKDINQIPASSLRSQIACVPQEPKLFDRSVKDNISYRRKTGERISDSDVVAAASTANAHGFISKLEGQYDYRVGHFGENLSGGQCQRVAIARSVYGNEGNIKILLLDEATSALDNESQELVQAALEKAAQDKTTIFVAHRLSTIEGVDKIFVLENGEVTEQGTFEELFELGGTFTELAKSSGRTSIATKDGKTSKRNTVMRQSNLTNFTEELNTVQVQQITV